MLPLLNNDFEQLKLTKEFLQSSKLRVSIEEPRRNDAAQTRLSIDENIRTYSETPYYFYLDEKPNINVVVSNIGVGHSFPGGTKDINEACVRLNKKL